MAIPKLKKQNIIDALKFIDEKGVPDHNASVKYALVSGAGKKYPPKYVVAVADHLANGTDISTTGFNAVEAKNYLEGQGFTIETKQQEKFELTITAESVESTDECFTMDNLSLGDNYKPLDAYFQRANGDIIRRAYNKGERRNTNQTLPRIACQVFEKQLATLPVEDRSEAIRRMSELNKTIAEVEDLNENYQIGAAYFAKLRTLDFDQLWTDYLQPLLQEYIQGMYDEEGIMNRFARAYGYQKPARGDENEAAQDQG